MTMITADPTLLVALAVVVKATVYEGNDQTAVTGAVLVENDVVNAAVRALLHAVNRKLRPPASAPI